MTTVIDLPVNTINSTVNVDNPAVLDSIKTMAETFMKDSATRPVIRSIYSIPDTSDKLINIKTDLSFITAINRFNITKKPDNVKYFKIHVKFFPNEKEVDLIVPSFIKFFSKSARAYIPAEYIRKSDILIDYQGWNVQVFENEEITDYKLPGEYYHISINTNNDHYFVTFYYDGIFAAASTYPVSYEDAPNKENDEGEK